MFSVIIPVFDEEAILEVAIRSLVAKLQRKRWKYELLISENGSRDRTLLIARDLAEELTEEATEEFGGVRVLHTDQPNYGLALRRGIDAARGELIICDEIDLGDLDFYERALATLAEGADMVVGSKRHPQSIDARPWIRRRGTQVINGMLRLSLGFTGTDTHGLKAFRRTTMMPVVRACIVEHDLFASELVIRAMRDGYDVREIPLRVREIRPPSVALARRVPRVLRNLAKLIYVIRMKS